MLPSRIDETIRRQFESAWQRGVPMAIADLLPDLGSRESLATLEELVMIDLEFRWKNRLTFSSQVGDVQTATPTSIEQYLAEFPLLNEPTIVRRLIVEAIHVRSRYGNESACPADLVAEYQSRFPEADLTDMTTQVDDGSEDAAAAAGKQLGRYQLIELHARGGFGEVWRAFDRVLKRIVALKTIQPRFEHDEQLLQRFENEAKTTAKLEHPGIVSVHELGHDTEQPYYTMRFLRGNTMAEAIAAFHQLEVSHPRWSVARLRLLNAYLSVGRAVEFAHAKRTIHRDLKPQNIVLGDYGEISILDWGLAKQISIDDRECQAEQTSAQPPPSDRSPKTNCSSKAETPIADGLVTQDGSMVGTPAYMSPEQFAGRVEQVDKRSDQFCLGAILYQLLTGEPPRYSTTAVIDRTLIPPRDLRRTVEPSLEAICLRAMSVSPTDRYESVSDLIADVERFLADEPVSVLQEPWTAQATRWVKRHRTGVTATVSGLIIATLVSAAALVLLLDVNRDLSAKKQESEFLRVQAEAALDRATNSLYSHAVGLAYAEWQKNNVVRAQALLDECPTALRDWEWGHLAALIKRQTPIMKLTEHQSFIRAVAVSHDGTKVASGDSNGVIVVYDIDSQKVLASFDFVGTARAVAFDNLDRHLIIGGDHRLENEQDRGFKAKLIVWDWVADELVHDLPVSGRAIFDVTIDESRGMILAAEMDGPVTGWGLTSGKSAAQFSMETNSVRSLCTLAHGDLPPLLAAANNEQIRVWDLESKTVIASVEADDQACLCFSYAGSAANDEAEVRLWSGGADGMIRVWKLPTETNNDANDASDTSMPSGALVEVRRLPGHTDKVRSIAFDPHHRLVASAGNDRTIHIWDTRQERLQQIVRHHTSHVRDLDFSPDGQFLFSVGDEREVNGWLVDHLNRSMPTGEFVAYSPVDNRLAVANKQRLLLRDAAGEELHSINLREFGEITSLTFSSDGQWIACGSRDAGATLVNAEDGFVTRLNSDSKTVHGLAFSPDNQQIAGSCEDEQLRFWRTADGTFSHSFETEGVVVRLEFDSTSSRIIGGFTTGQIAWWELDGGQCVRRIEAHHRFLSGLAMLADQDLLATSGIDGAIKIWKLSTGELLREMTVGASWLNCLAFSNDGQRLLSGSEQTVTFWEPLSGREVISISLDRCVHNMSFNPQGNRLALAGESPRIRIWSTESTALESYGLPIENGNDSW